MNAQEIIDSCEVFRIKEFTDLNKNQKDELSSFLDSKDRTVKIRDEFNLSGIINDVVKQFKQKEKEYE